MHCRTKALEAAALQQPYKLRVELMVFMGRIPPSALPIMKEQSSQVVPNTAAPAVTGGRREPRSTS